MFGEEESAGMFEAPPVAGANTRPQAPLVSGGLFGGSDLKETEPVAAGGKSKLGSIFDYEEEEDEKPSFAQKEEQKKPAMNNKGGLFQIDEDEEDERISFIPGKAPNLFG